MMELKILCPTCKGKGTEFPHVRGRDECDDCGGKGHTNPPQEVLDDLECAEIKRQIKRTDATVFIKILSFATRMNLIFDLEVSKEFFGENELEALRKAKEWLDQKGGE